MECHDVFLRSSAARSHAGASVCRRTGASTGAHGCAGQAKARGSTEYQSTREVNMSSTGVGTDTSTGTPELGTVDMKLEVVTLAVSDVDRAKAFYQSLGWRLDADIVRGENFRVVQVTPPHSACSVSFGKGVTTAEPGSAQRLILAVDDIDAAREALVRRGAEVSGVFHLDGGRVPGPDPEGRSYQTYASFSDPDGNAWLLQEIKTRLPGREWES